MLRTVVHQHVKENFMARSAQTDAAQFHVTYAPFEKAEDILDAASDFGKPVIVLLLLSRQRSTNKCFSANHRDHSCCKDLSRLFRPYITGVGKEDAAAADVIT